MTVTADAMRELHRIHRQLTDLRERLARGPRQIRARQSGIKDLETKLAAQREAIKATKMNIDRKQVDLKAGETKIGDLKVKLNTCSSNKEYQALRDQIAAAEMANSVLADEILEGLEEIDTLEETAQTAAEAVTAAEDDLAKLQQQVNESTASLEADVARLEGELAVAEQNLPQDFKPDYERVVRAKGEDSMAAVEGEVCGGCFQQITPNEQNELYMGRVIFCRACGRLMYLPEGRTKA